HDWTADPAGERSRWHCAVRSRGTRPFSREAATISARLVLEAWRAVRGALPAALVVPPTTSRGARRLCARRCSPRGRKASGHSRRSPLALASRRCHYEQVEAPARAPMRANIQEADVTEDCPRPWPAGKRAPLSSSVSSRGAFAAASAPERVADIREA